MIYCSESVGRGGGGGMGSQKDKHVLGKMFYALGLATLGSSRLHDQQINNDIAAVKYCTQCIILLYCVHR